MWCIMTLNVKNVLSHSETILFIFNINQNQCIQVVSQTLPHSSSQKMRQSFLVITAHHPSRCLHGFLALGVFGKWRHTERSGSEGVVVSARLHTAVCSRWVILLANSSQSRKTFNTFLIFKKHKRPSKNFLPIPFNLSYNLVLVFIFRKFLYQRNYPTCSLNRWGTSPLPNVFALRKLTANLCF